MLQLVEDLDYAETVCCAVTLLSYIIRKYNIKTFEDFSCPYMKALAEELYQEVV